MSSISRFHIDVPELPVLHGCGSKYCPHASSRGGGRRLVIIQRFHSAEPLSYETAFVLLHSSIRDCCAGGGGCTRRTHGPRDEGLCVPSLASFLAFVFTLGETPRHVPSFPASIATRAFLLGVLITDSFLDAHPLWVGISHLRDPVRETLLGGVAWYMTRLVCCGHASLSRRVEHLPTRI